MRFRHPQLRTLPRLWLVSDARNDAVLERALSQLPRGSGIVFRHYHLDANARRARFAAVARICRCFGHRLLLAGDAAQARRWGADGYYGANIGPARGLAMLRLVTVHDMRELRRANAGRADAVFLSPVFATRSHPGAQALGPARFALMARHAAMPVIALGGMNRRNFRRVADAAHGWAAIDGLSF